MKKDLLAILVLFIFLVGCGNEQEPPETEDDFMYTGTWSGEIEIPNQPLKINVTLEEKEGAISIPVQGVDKYPLNTIKTDKDNILFTMQIQGQSITFDGKLDGGKIAGTFKQNGQSFPFILTKGKASAANDEEDGTFLQMETEQGTLHGELERPEGEGPFPIMIIIPGSGPTDRNGNAATGKNNSLKYVAEALAEEGIASLRYDKRGAGKNMAAARAEEDTDFNLFVEDAKAWIELLVQDDNYSKVGIIGHSQGSLTGMLAAQKGNVGVFVSLAGAGRSLDEVLYDQLSEQLPKDLLKESKEILTQLKKGKTVEHVSQELQSVFRPSVQPFLMSWMQYNPAAQIQKMDIPTLIVNGKNDLQVPVCEAEILHEAKADADILLVEPMNHVLKEAPEDRKGNIATYSDPDLPLAKGLMDGILAFLKENEFTN